MQIAVAHPSRQLNLDMKVKLYMPKSYVYLTNRFHVAVRLFSNRSQMTSKCGENKKVAHEAWPSVSLMFLPHFDLLLNQTHVKWNLFVLYNNEKPFFYFKIFQHIAKAGLLPRLCPTFARKKPFDVIYDLNKMKQFHWLLCVAKNCDWSIKIAPLSNLTRASPLVE